MENRTFIPLEIITQHPYILKQSIKAVLSWDIVTEISLDATEYRIKTIFSKFEKIVCYFMETKNLWQQATITYSIDTDFNALKGKYRVFVLNDMVRFHMCDLSHGDILARSKFSAKLAGLPHFTNGKQLTDIEHMVNTLSWVIPKVRSNYHNL
ncbi:19054_t:CDS:2 [Funneliformis geosporum]|nr:19054_t:CDS:2 [Funneliformis geosporum]